VKEWHRRYAEHGLSVIGVHAPEFQFARRADLVESALREHGIEYPVVIDNDYQIWQAFANRCWPAKYLIDKDGYIRFFHWGEGAYGDCEEAIQQLLIDSGAAANLPALMAPLRALDAPGVMEACQRPTPELYIGAARGRIANPGGFIVDGKNPNEGKLEQYRYGTAPPPDDLPELDGWWVAQREAAAVAASGNDPQPSSLRLRYSAAEVNVVLAPPPGAGAARVEITDNGRPVTARGADVLVDDDGSTFLRVERPRMYSLLYAPEFRSGLLELRSGSTGLEVYAFTFVTCVGSPA
jgi:hypothetical protein